MSAPLVHQFTEALEKVVDQFRDQGLTISEAVGAPELLKAEIIKDGLEEAQEGEEPWKT